MTNLIALGLKHTDSSRSATPCGGSSNKALREPQSHSLGSGSTVNSLMSDLLKIVVAAIWSHGSLV